MLLPSPWARTLHPNGASHQLRHSERESIGIAHILQSDWMPAAGKLWILCEHPQMEAAVRSSDCVSAVARMERYGIRATALRETGEGWLYCYFFTGFR